MLVCSDIIVAEGVPLVQSTIVDRLRAETRSEHTALETTLALELPTLTQQKYVRVLEAFYGFYVVWERHLEPWTKEVYEEHTARHVKTPRLVEDLRSFGVSISSLPICEAVPAFASLPAALGSMYVMEGATLGGQLITRKVHGDLGAAGAAGCRFFASYGDQVGAMWRAFRRTLQVRITGAEAEDSAVAAAKETFLTFRVWLEECGF